MPFLSPNQQRQSIRLKTLKHWQQPCKIRHRVNTSMCSLTFLVCRYAVMCANCQCRVALCCHSNETRAPTANPPNTAQPWGTPYHTPKLHPGPCSSVGMRPQTDTQTDRQTHRQMHVTTIHFALSMTHAKCNHSLDLILSGSTKWFMTVRTSDLLHQLSVPIQYKYIPNIQHCKLPSAVCDLDPATVSANERTPVENSELSTHRTWNEFKCWEQS